MKKGLKIIGVIIIIVVAISFIFDGVSEESIKKDIDRIENQVAMEAVEKYEIAKRNGNDMDAYVQASMAAAAFLEANDEENYKKWKEIEKQEAKKVGL